MVFSDGNFAKHAAQKPSKRIDSLEKIVLEVKEDFDIRDSSRTSFFVLCERTDLKTSFKGRVVANSFAFMLGVISIRTV